MDMVLGYLTQKQIRNGNVNSILMRNKLFIYKVTTNG
jgi:hypothetical protein